MPSVVFHLHGADHDAVVVNRGRNAVALAHVRDFQLGDSRFGDGSAEWASVRGAGGAKACCAKK
jgi:hypothetical protein